MTGGLRIIVTRPQPDADFTALKLRDLGHHPLVSPSLEFLPLDIKLPDPGKLNGLVVTSVNALRAIRERGLLSPFLSLHAWVVGDATADTARAFGFKTVTSAEGTATDLALLLNKVKQPLRLFYASGRDRAADLVAMLRAGGHFVVSCPVYEMRPIPDLQSSVILALEAATVDAALFYSVRSAESFAEGVRKATGAAFDLPCLCLSEPIAGALRARGFTRCYPARQPTEAALFELLETFSVHQFGP
ncbi:MAG: uroporphyrinogen-III synthase [Cucumibacter sp.]